MADTGNNKVDLEHVSSNEGGRDVDKGATDDKLAESGVANLDVARRRGLQPPEIIARLSPDERLALEAKLRKKIDLRLLPMVIIMYIMNYIDRSVPEATLLSLSRVARLDGVTDPRALI